MEKACASVDCTTGGRTGHQDALIADVAAANPNTIAVLETGDPVLTPWRAGVQGAPRGLVPGRRRAARALARVAVRRRRPGRPAARHLPRQRGGPPHLRRPPPSTRARPTCTTRRASSSATAGSTRHAPHAPRSRSASGSRTPRFRYGNLRLTPTAASFDRPRTPAGAPEPTCPQLYVGDPASTGEPPKQLKGIREGEPAPGADHARDLADRPGRPVPLGREQRQAGRSRPAATG